MSNNADQVEFWNGPAADRWIKHQGALDRALEPFGRLALEAARPQSGERAIDVGCGCGWTTLALAEAVGPSGAVLGVDLSEPMLRSAREGAARRGLANVTFACGDASTYAFDAAFDLVFSRFGVMFFGDPTAAFAHLHRALRPGGRVAFVCWALREKSPWYRIPIAAAGKHVPLPPPAGPEEPGPFSFSDRARVQRILEGAGFAEATIEAASSDYVFGPDLDTAATFATETGPVSRLLADADDATRARVRAAIREAFEPHVGPRGVALAAPAWVVRARRS